MSAGDARRVAERAARDSYGRLVALLASRSRDIAAAEDALSDAFRAALETWPERGVPDRPEAWLLTAARRALGHAWRHRGVREAAASTIELLHDQMQAAEAGPVPDERLKLLFVCAHPAIDEGARTPLMLQAVLGLDAGRIASAFLVAPSAMSQRMVRAKAKIRDVGIRFAPPEAEDLAPRLEAVLGAIYAAFGTAWDAAPGADGGDGLADEAIDLARILAVLLPEEPEAHGLLALMLHVRARAAARRGPDGAFVPLDRQDARLWSRPLIAQAERHLALAARAGRPGRYQTEAAIQSVHAQAGLTGPVPAGILVALHDLLARQAPTVGGLVARAAVHGEAFGPAAGLACLEAIEEGAVSTYQPYWAVRGHLLHREGDAAASAALMRAAGLSEDPAVRAYLTALAAS